MVYNDRTSHQQQHAGLKVSTSGMVYNDRTSPSTTTGTGLKPRILILPMVYNDRTSPYFRESGLKTCLYLTLGWSTMTAQAQSTTTSSTQT